MPGAPIVYSPPAPTLGNVLVGTGICWTAPVGSSLPSDQNLGNATSWTGAGWTYVGATDQGVSVSYNPSTVDIRIEEQETPVQTIVDSATLQISFDISEETVAGINLAYGNGGTVSVTAAGAGQPGKTVLNLSTNFVQMAAALLGKNAAGFPHILYVPAVMSAGTVATSYRRAAAQRMYPTTLNAVCAQSSIQFIDITSLATS